MDRWVLSDAEVGRLLQAMGLKALAGSPLWKGGQGTETTASISIQPTPQLRQALSRLARPDRILGVVANPPEAPDYHWLYGARGESNLVLYRGTPQGEHELAWPFPVGDVREDLETALHLDWPLLGEKPTMRMDLPTLSAVAAIVDLRQEDLLLSVLQRASPPEFAFDAGDLLGCFERSPASTALNWVVQRLRLVSPVPLRPTAEELGKALEELRGRRLLHRRNRRYCLAEEMGPFTLMLGHCRGMGAVSLHHRDGEGGYPDRWTRRHLVFLRSLTGLATLEFENVEGTDPAVVLAGRSGEEVVHLLEQILPLEAVETEGKTFRAPMPHPPTRGEPTPPPQEEAPSPTQPGPSPAPKPAFCPQCGKALRPGLEFCTGCGSRLDTR